MFAAWGCDRMNATIRVGIAGAGAVGCFYGLALQRAGLDMVFLARGEHLQALQRTGLLYESAGEKDIFTVDASDDVEILADCDVILLCCKTTQLDDMSRSLLHVAKPTVTWLTLQNGVRAADQVSIYFPHHHVFAASAFIGVRIEKAGHVIHSAAGHIRLGSWSKGKSDVVMLKPLQDAWQKAGVDAKVEADMRMMLWQKMLWNCGFNAVTALIKRYARDVALHDEMSVWVRVAMLEVIAVADAVGVKLDENMVDKHMRMTCEAGEVKSSMWQDMSHQKPTEIAAMNGYIAEQGKKFDIATPINSMLANMIELAEGAYLVR